MATSMPSTMRLCTEIMEHKERKRNILYIKTIKIRSEETLAPDFKGKAIGELLFNILNVNPVHCLAYD